MTATFVFTCSICGEPSQTICAYCTKDACANHLCDRCKRCSDCCECEVRLQDEVPPPPLVLETHQPAPEPLAVEPEPGAEEPEPLVEPEPIAAEAPDLSKLFAPEPEMPAPQPDLSALFAPEPHEQPAPPSAQPPAPSSEPDLSKLFAPDPPPKPKPPVFTAGEDADAEEAGSGQESEGQNE